MRKFFCLPVFILTVIFSVAPCLVVAQDFNAVKKADLAGQWYSADKKQLTKMLQGYLDQAALESVDGRIFGLILPHAGYEFCGPVAACGLKAVQNKGVKTVVVLGFSHRKPLSGIAIYNGAGFATPLGQIDIDKTASAKLIDLLKSQNMPGDLYYDGDNSGVFDDENSMEMIIPFVQTALPGVKIVPVLMSSGMETIEPLSLALKEMVKADPGLLVIASSDMSHFHPYDEAKSMDAVTIENIKAGEIPGFYQALQRQDLELCGIGPVITLMSVKNSLDNSGVKIFKYANSGDATGDKTSVVGYVSAAFYQTTGRGPQTADTKIEKKQGGAMDEYTLNNDEKKLLLKMARQTLEEFLKTGKIAKFPKPVSAALSQPRGAFVTLTDKNGLRGCIGRIVGDTPVYEVIPEYAIHAAIDDPRFPPVQYEELKNIQIEISVLTPFTDVKSLDEIEVGKHGLMIQRGFSSGLLLPQVPIEWGWDKTTFLEETCRKAGLPKDAYKDKASKLSKFSAIVFNEAEFK